MGMLDIQCSRDLLQEDTFINQMILLSEEIFAFLFIVSTTGDTYIEDIWTQKCVY